MCGERGFTLLEVLVAFVIAALALAVLAHAGLDGLYGAQLSSRYQEALARAKSHLAAVGDTPTPSDLQADEGDGFHWHVRIVPLATTGAATTIGSTLTAGAAPPPITLLAVSVAISWGTPRRSVELDSERLVAGSAGNAP
jgi:general secretion pathway protein I